MTGKRLARKTNPSLPLGLLKEGIFNYAKMRNKKFTLWISETQLVYFNNFHQILLQYSPLPPRRDRLRIPLVARGPWKEDRPH